MRILIACEFSGVVREAFRRKGDEAVSCDLLPTEIPGVHIQGDVLKHLDEGWDMMIAFPPCTYLCNSGVRWIHEQFFERWPKVVEASKFFKILLQAPIPQIAVENPIQHGYAKELIGRKYDQIVQPYEFGEPETKATALWLIGFPLLKPTKVQRQVTLDQVHVGRVHHESPSKDRWKNRSRTLPGIAEAMASQWG